MYESGEYFVTALIMAGEIFRQAADVLLPLMTAAERPQDSRKVVIATVKGDIHDIGKNIVVTLLEARGFTVVDLGVDVDPELVADAVVAERPDVLGLSCLLTTGIRGPARDDRTRARAHRRPGAAPAGGDRRNGHRPAHGGVRGRGRLVHRRSRRNRRGALPAGRCLTRSRYFDTARLCWAVRSPPVRRAGRFSSPWRAGGPAGIAKTPTAPASGPARREGRPACRLWRCRGLPRASASRRPRLS